MSYAPNLLFHIKMQKLTEAFKKHNMEQILKQSTDNKPDNLIREQALKKLMILEKK